MKKLKITLLLLALSLLLCSCGTQTLSIEDCEWKMRTVMRGGDGVTADTADFIVCVGEADEVYPEAKIIDLTLEAENGIITVEDLTNGKTYTGTYKVISKTPKGTDYELVINGQTGYATVAPTKYYNGTEVPTLPINFGDYSLYFVPMSE